MYAIRSYYGLVLTVGFRDLLIVSGYLAYTSLIGPTQMRPTYLSKLNTFLQIALVVGILGQQAELLPVGMINHYLVYAVFATTIASGVHYVVITSYSIHYTKLYDHVHTGTQRCWPV